MSWLDHLEWRAFGCLAVEFDPQSRSSWRQQVAVLPLHLDRHHIHQSGAWPSRLLLYAKVAARQVHVQAGCARDRPERVVRDQLDVVGLTPTHNLARLGDATDDAQ